MLFSVFRLKKVLPSFLFGGYLFWMLLRFPSECMQAAKDGLNLSLYLLFPSLFPFLVTAKYLVLSGSAKRLSRLAAPVTKRLFGLPQSAAACFVLGAVSGCPVGAAVICDAVKSGSLTRAQGEHLLPFCNLAGPLFVIGTVGVGMLASPVCGYLLYGIHLLSAVLCAIACKRRAPKATPAARTVQTASAASPLTDAVGSAVPAFLRIGGFFVFFSVLQTMLTLTGMFRFLPDGAAAFCKGLLEMTGGVNAVARTSLSAPLKMGLISALLSLSGLCIFFQAKDAAPALSFRRYVSGKLLCAVLSFCIAYAVFTVFPVAVPAFAAMTPKETVRLSASILFWLSLVPSIGLLLLAKFF